MAWVSSGCPDLSSTEVDTGTGEMSLSGASSLSRTGISPIVGEEMRLKKMMRNGSYASTHRSRQQILVPHVQDLMQVGTCFPKVRKCCFVFLL